jgi:hypothetical protein
MSCYGLPVRRIDPSISSVVDHYLFFILGGNRVYSEGFCKLAFLGYFRRYSVGIPLFSLLDWILLNFA